MIYCVWYPSGGFGHFVNAVLTLHGDNFVRPNNSLEFSAKGDSHSLDLVVPKYRKDKWPGGVEFLDDKNYCILVDNGINNESTVFKKVFTDSAKVIKICYSDTSWPIVARTLINKAMGIELSSALPLGSDWEQLVPWAAREKYFLYLRDHPLRHAWQPNPTAFSLPVATLFDYVRLKNLLSTFGVECSNFENLHKSMVLSNQQYLSGVDYADKIIDAIKHDTHIDLSHITDLWDQAVINYFIHLNFDFEIPANTYSNWFSNTLEISKLL